MKKWVIIGICGIVIIGIISTFLLIDKFQKEEVVAVVNGVEITKDEFVQRLKLQAESSPAGILQMAANETEDEYVQRLTSLIGKPVLEYMITETIIKQKAEEQEVKVKPEEIDVKIDEIKDRFPSEEAFVEFVEKHVSGGRLRQQLEIEILIEKLVLKESIATEEEIRDYFEGNKARFDKPEQIRASHILVRAEEEAKEISSQLKAGADFAGLAKEKSIDPTTKDKGGDIGFFSLGQMTYAFEKAAFALEVGEISDVVKTPYGYHIIRLEEKKPAQKATLELAREEIKETLTQQKAWTKRSTFLEDLKKEAKIEIMLPELKDVKKCGTITDTFGKDVCYSKTARETKDVSLCEKITDAVGKDVCYSNIALDTKDINLCEKIKKSDVKDTCYSNTIPETKDASLCEKINKSSLREYCYFNVVKKTKYFDLCEKIITRVDLKDSCYSNAAQETKDVSLCEEITEGNRKDNCYEKIAVKIKDINLCEKVTDKNNCRIDVAMEAGDIGLCEKITDTVEKDVCYYGVVSVTKDSSMCEKMTTSLGKDECYFNVAMLTKDINLCEKISDAPVSVNMKDQCYSQR